MLSDSRAQCALLACTAVKAFVTNSTLNLYVEVHSLVRILV